MKLVFDIGMYDGADTEYYLTEGYTVVAVEANPQLVEKASRKFSDYLASGQLRIVNKAISDTASEEITLYISGQDLGSSSIFDDQVSEKDPAGSFSVNTTTLSDLIQEFGTPHFIKVDIEGADKYCILPITSSERPEYVSFEAGEDIAELVSHLENVGFTRFKAINQCNFYELSNQETFVFRLKRKLIHMLGYSSPTMVRMNGRFFRLMHSAGPAPWVSDGKWHSAADLMTTWRQAESSGELRGWYDVHAS